AAKIVEWDELSEALNQALATDSDDAHEAQIAAQGLAKAATLLAGQYSWVITNVPYLARGKQDAVLQKYCEKYYPAGKNDLATVFLDRCLELCTQGGNVSVVLPQNWLFLTSYKKIREKLLTHDTWEMLARLGPGAFDTISGEVVKAILVSISRGQRNKSVLGQPNQHQLRGLDVSEAKSAQLKSEELVSAEVHSVDQLKQLDNPDAKVILKKLDKQDGNLLDVHLVAPQGIITGDADQWRKSYWEVMPSCPGWIGFQSAPTKTSHFVGKSYAVDWRTKGAAMVRPRPDCFAFNRKGVIVGQMRNLPGSLYYGDKFDGNVAPLIPTDSKELPAVWAFISSAEFRATVRELDQKLNVTNGSFLQVSFDINYWSGVAQDKYPNGLPQPYTNDPTQWIFHGHPCGSVIWHLQDKATAVGELRKDDTVLQVALARLLGYRWPAELDSDMDLAPEQRQWVDACEPLLALMDDDGIACLPAVRGEPAAADRLVHMLEAAYGEAWNINVQAELLAAVGANSLDAWLRDKFFVQHCKLFQNRPFIWQIWDGL
ncbi:Eco57I restriction-modification methylase domain-containing protein, partial [Dasania marina]|uniref:Eco57I restriction-modification methylase domain-containing protein n=1 Tax=Dasania marina TaxID=471499 RepID=UPI000368D6CB